MKIGHHSSFGASDGSTYAESLFVVLRNLEIFRRGSRTVSERSRGGRWRDLSGHVRVRYSRYDGIPNAAIGGVKNGVVKKMLSKDARVREHQRPKIVGRFEFKKSTSTIERRHIYMRYCSR